MDNQKQIHKILKSQDFKTSTWSGGTTKQLFIYPQNSEYSKRNFKFRISIATTQNQTSTFTKLENVERVISILQGKMEINHEGHYSKILLPGDIDRFRGDWNTTSKGKVTDFNLMLKDCKGDFFYLPTNQHKQIEGKEGDNNVMFVYCIAGQVRVNNQTLEKEQLLITTKNKLSIQTEKQGSIFYGYVLDI